MHHPPVLLCAVVAKAGRENGARCRAPSWKLKEGATADAAEIIAFARQRLAGFKTPKHVVFQELPKTSTGKIQKFELRKAAADL